MNIDYSTCCGAFYKSPRHRNPDHVSEKKVFIVPSKIKFSEYRKHVVKTPKPDRSECESSLKSWSQERHFNTQIERETFNPNPFTFVAVPSYESPLDAPGETIDC